MAGIRWRGEGASSSFPPTHPLLCPSGGNLTDVSCVRCREGNHGSPASTNPMVSSNQTTSPLTRSEPHFIPLWFKWDPRLALPLCPRPQFKSSRSLSAEKGRHHARKHFHTSPGRERIHRALLHRCAKCTSDMCPAKRQFPVDSTQNGS